MKKLYLFFVIIVSMLFCAISVSASEHSVVYDQLLPNTSCVCSLQNKGSEKWMSTSLNSSTYYYLWNVFQTGSWNNQAQTFVFSPTEEDNCYILYTIEKNSYGLTSNRALYCNYRQIANGSSSVNVTYAAYNANYRDGYVWKVIKQNNSYVICLKAYPQYYLCVTGTATGSDSDYSSSGNIIVSNSTISDNYKNWCLYYVVEDGNYYLKNVGQVEYLYSNQTFGDTPYLSWYSSHYGDSPDFDYSLLHNIDLKYQWTVTHIADGFYSITTPNGYALTMSSNSVPVAGSHITLQPYAAYPNQLWRFVSTGGGKFRLKSQHTAGSSVDWSMSVVSLPLPLNGSTIYVAVNDSVTSNNNVNDDWTLERLNEVYTFIGIEDNNNPHDHFSVLDNQETHFTYHNIIDFIYTDYLNPLSFHYILPRSKIVITRSHGNHGQLVCADYCSECNGYCNNYYSDTCSCHCSCCNNYSDEDFEGSYIQLCSQSSNTRLTAGMLYDFQNEEPYIDCSNIDLVLFVGCYTALPEERSLPMAAVLCGAKNAIGFTEEINCPNANSWTYLFCELYRMHDYETISDILASMERISARYYDYLGNTTTSVRLFTSSN